MELICDKSKNLLIIHWEFLNIFINGQELVKKDKQGIPGNILNSLSTKLREQYNELENRYNGEIDNGY